MSRIRFWQGARNSKSAFALRKALREEGRNVFRIKAQGSKYRAGHGDIVINWGSSSTFPYHAASYVLNGTGCVAMCSDKRAFFEALDSEGVRELPLFFTNQSDAYEYMDSLEGDDEECIMYCRTLVSSNQGKGIIIAENKYELVNAGLYTVGISNIAREVRVHVFMDSILDVTQKKRMSTERLEEEGIESADEMVRNHDNGWIFARQDVCISSEIEDTVKVAATCLGLDFGAFDIIECEDGSFYLLEANTAPGITGTTLERYKDAILNI